MKAFLRKSENSLLIQKYLRKHLHNNGKTENFNVLICHWTIPPKPVHTNQVFIVQHIAQLQIVVAEILSVIAMEVSIATKS